MANRFVVMELREAGEIGLDVSGWYDVDCRWCVVEHTEGGPRIIGSDGGEPEDQLLVRDWDWVAPALCAAYEAGLRAGRSEDRSLPPEPRP